MRHVLLLLAASIPATPRAEGPPPTSEGAPLVDGAAPAQAEVFAVGDSVLLGAREHLLALSDVHVTVDAVVCRQATHSVPGPVTCAGTSFPQGISSGLAVLREARARGALGGAVVLMLGSNEGIAAPQFEELMQELADVPLVLWTTNTVRWQRRTNEVLRAGVARHPNAGLLDWARLSRGKPWFGKDGIHLNRAGRKAFAELVAHGLRLPGGAPPEARLPAGPCCAGQERAASSR
ncbi:MAG TPA: hypothetical protein VEB43_05215 [Anaeromyxobacter sp.]|nr:hypothetical protein [Anaeromyxobacter sp.]